MSKNAGRFVPYAETFADEEATRAALGRIGEVLDGAEAGPEDLRRLLAGLVINPEQLPRSNGQSPPEASRRYLEALTGLLHEAEPRAAAEGATILGKALRQELLLGWVNLDKVASVHPCLGVLVSLLERGELRAVVLGELAATVVSPRPLVPIDVRGEAADLLVEAYRSHDFPVLEPQLLAAFEGVRPLPVKSLRDHVLSGTDTIDCPFVFPPSSEERCNVLWNAAVEKARERAAIDALRVTRRLGRTDDRMAALCRTHADRVAAFYDGLDEYLSHPEAEEFISSRLTSETRRVEDYIVHPNQRLCGYTVSDLTRVMSLSPECFWPDRGVRTAWTAFARSVLGFCRVANVGLGAKMVFITHGCDAASLVYVGQATVVGKGSNLDLTGGLLIGARNYTGSFWSDTSLHGHLHVGDDQRGIGGTLSRLAIEPYIMVLDDDVAFPPGLGYIEAAHHAEGEQHAGEIRGFRALRAVTKPLVPQV